MSAIAESEMLIRLAVDYESAGVCKNQLVAICGCIAEHEPISGEHRLTIDRAILDSTAHECFDGRAPAQRFVDQSRNERRIIANAPKYLGVFRQRPHRRSDRRR